MPVRFQGQRNTWRSVKMATIYTEQLYSLGVSVSPRVIILSNRLGNMPTEGMFSGDYSFWVPFRGAQWYIKY